MDNNQVHTVRSVARAWGSPACSCTRGTLAASGCYTTSRVTDRALWNGGGVETVLSSDTAESSRGKEVTTETSQSG